MSRKPIRLPEIHYPVFGVNISVFADHDTEVEESGGLPKVLSRW